jgi:hypothetical protein
VNDDANAFLMAAGTKSFKFAPIGAIAKGTIESIEIQQQRSIDDGALLFWDDAKTQPKKQVRIVLQTEDRDDGDDDGRRAIYVKGQMQNAVRDAVIAAGADKLEEGGTLAVQYVSDGEPPKKGMNAPKQYKAQYKQPSITPAAVAVDDLL